MKRSVALLDSRQNFKKDEVIKKRTCLDCQINTGIVLNDCPAGADGLMPCLGIAWFPIQQADRFSGSFKLRKRALSRQPVPYRGSGHENVIGFIRFSETPPIQDNE